jgi:hypothetical protein
MNCFFKIFYDIFVNWSIKQDKKRLFGDTETVYTKVILNRAQQMHYISIIFSLYYHIFTGKTDKTISKAFLKQMLNIVLIVYH